MKLSRIRIEQFRQFQQPLVIEALTPGINLFSGPNEAGKSTIVAAIRAAFFERYRSGSIEDLRPWGDASAAPTVELTFSTGGRQYRLIKSFLARKRCELQTGPQRLEGAEAEARLAALLGFDYAVRGSSRAEYWGIPGLLWIQQGAAHSIEEPVAHATDYLRAALNDSLGEVTSSDGDDIIAAVKTARDELLSDVKGAPRGAYLKALQNETELGETLDRLEAEIAHYRQQVDRLAQLRHERATGNAEKNLDNFHAQRHIVAANLDSVRKDEELLAAAQQRTTQLEHQIALLRGRMETFAHEEEEREKRRIALTDAEQRLVAATAQADQWQSTQTEAAAQYEMAREVLRRARQNETQHRLRHQLQELSDRTEALNATLERARQEQKRLQELRAQAAASYISDDDLAELRKQERRLQELRIRQHGIATRMHFSLNEDSHIRIGSESVSGTGERRLLEATPITLPGLGTLEITPGGTDLDHLKHEINLLDDTQTALLQRLALLSTDAAEARYQDHKRTLAEIETCAAALGILTPHGIETLETELATLKARGAEIRQALDRQPAADFSEEASPTAVSDAEAAEERARRSFEQGNAALSTARLAAGNAQTAYEAACRELAAAQARIDAPEQQHAMALTDRRLAEARADVTANSRDIEAMRRRIAEARPELLRQDIERLSKSIEQTEQQISERRERLIRLEAELETLGAQGLEERRAALAQQLAAARRRVTELRRRADALELLLRLLRGKRHALTIKLQAPLRKHLNRYLQILFPGASVEIDENLTPGPLTRNAATTDAFDALSFGAREQIGVISRLAYADLLKEAGRPTLIILDDALVHSDATRLAQMKRILFDASARHQILLFTCHPDNWQDIGAPIRAISDLRAAATTS